MIILFFVVMLILTLLYGAWEYSDSDYECLCGECGEDDLVSRHARIEKLMDDCLRKTGDWETAKSRAYAISSPIRAGLDRATLKRQMYSVGADDHALMVNIMEPETEHRRDCKNCGAPWKPVCDYCGS